MVPQMVMQREAAGLPPSKCCVADELLRAFFSSRTCEDLPGSGRVIDLSEGFFRLGAFVDWLAPRRDEHLRQCRELDNVLLDQDLGSGKAGLQPRSERARHDTVD